MSIGYLASKHCYIYWLTSLATLSVLCSSDVELLPYNCSIYRPTSIYKFLLLYFLIIEPFHFTISLHFKVFLYLDADLMTLRCNGLRIDRERLVSMIEDRSSRQIRNVLNLTYADVENYINSYRAEHYEVS